MTEIEQSVPSLIYALESRFLLVTWAWCNQVECERYGLKELPKRRKDNEYIQARGAIAAQRIRSEFLFAWLLQIEVIARRNHDGVVQLSGFDDALTYLTGQTIYNLFAEGSVRGPYRWPWDNASSFREHVLKPAASLMRSYERDESMKIPPEAVKLLELRGLKVRP